MENVATIAKTAPMIWKMVLISMLFYRGCSG